MHSARNQATHFVDPDRRQDGRGNVGSFQQPTALAVVDDRTASGERTPLEALPDPDDDAAWKRLARKQITL